MFLFFPQQHFTVKWPWTRVTTEQKVYLQKRVWINCGLSWKTCGFRKIFL